MNSKNQAIYDRIWGHLARNIDEVESAEDGLSRLLDALIAYGREVKPAERSEKARKMAIFLTDAEKLRAYFNHDIKNGGDSSPVF